MSAEAEISNFDTERFIVEVHSRIALWDMTTEAYSNRFEEEELGGTCGHFYEPRRSHCCREK
jgi:hypothetical protein